MEFNKELISSLKSRYGDATESIATLLCVEYNLYPDFISKDLYRELCRDGYLTQNGSVYRSTYNVLIERNINDPFDWVKTEFVPLFREYTKYENKTHSVPQTTSRLKKLFSEYPDIRKEDVIEASKLYLRNTEPKYVMFSHYFIEKGSGINKSNTILEWIEKYKLLKESQTGRNSITNTLQ